MDIRGEALKEAFLRALRHVVAPWRDLIRGLDRSLEGRGERLAWVFGGLLLGWWVYVPVHELLHVAGCVVTGGAVERLELDPMYGARWLRRIFPFIEPGGEYAGRLAGFDVRGSHWIYLATDLAPFLLALFPGLWLLRLLARKGRAFGYGASLPMAFSPWISWSGDAYEIGSLLVVQLPVWAEARELLVGDDLFARIDILRGAADPPWGGWIAGVTLGTIWAAGTTGLASWFASWLGQPPLGRGSRDA